MLFQESTGGNLTYAMSFLPLARSSAMLNFYGNIEGKQLCDGITEIVAMDFGKTFITGIIPYGKYHISWKINFSFCKLRSLTNLLSQCLINIPFIPGLKDTLFNAYLLEDANYLLFGLLLIFLSVWSFTASLTLTIASLSSIGAALGLAYFTYTFIFNLKFFPFMNVLAVVIALGLL